MQEIDEKKILLENVRICYSPFSRTTDTAKVVADVLGISFDSCQCKVNPSIWGHDVCMYICSVGFKLQGVSCDYEFQWWQDTWFHSNDLYICPGGNYISVSPSKTLLEKDSNGWK